MVECWNVERGLEIDQAEALLDLAKVFATIRRQPKTINSEFTTTSPF